MSQVPAYSVNLDGNILNIDFNIDFYQKNTENVKQLHTDLHQLRRTSLLGGPLLKINGRHSYPMSFVVAHAVAHLYGAIAVFDPETQKYVVSISHNPDYPIGAMLDENN